MRNGSIVIDGRRLDLSHLDKVLFPADGYTKGEVLDFYQRIAGVALPYYRDRPLVMHCFPDGLAGKAFVQADPPGHVPAWIDRVTLSDSNGGATRLIAGDAASLVYIAAQDCITAELALARRDAPQHPDRLIFDLDPPDAAFVRVQQAVLRLKELLDDLRLPAYLQTTGSRGLHVVVPLDRSARFDAAGAFAGRLAAWLARRHPAELTTEPGEERGRRVLIDCRRNAYDRTAVAPYALRARDGAPVATPLTWEEAAGSDLGPRDYTLKTIFTRLARGGDPWAKMDRQGASLDAAAERLNGFA